MMALIFRALARLEDHWIGDLLGAVSLFALLEIGLLLGHAWGLK